MYTIHTVFTESKKIKLLKNDDKNLKSLVFSVYGHLLYLKIIYDEFHIRLPYIFREHSVLFQSKRTKFCFFFFFARKASQEQHEILAVFEYIFK